MTEVVMCEKGLSGIELPEALPTLRMVPMPCDANHNGDIFGGWIMSQVDVAGGIAACRRANGRVTTVAVNSFLFKVPVRVGDIVSLYATIVETGRTSLKVAVAVYAERYFPVQSVVKVTEAVLTYVAINQHGEKRLLPEVEY